MRIFAIAIIAFFSFLAVIAIMIVMAMSQFEKTANSVFIRKRENSEDD